jgi:hypothetical protein
MVTDNAIMNAGAVINPTTTVIFGSSDVPTKTYTMQLNVFRNGFEKTVMQFQTSLLSPLAIYKSK